MTAASKQLEDEDGARARNGLPDTSGENETERHREVEESTSIPEKDSSEKTKEGKLPKTTKPRAKKPAEEAVKPKKKSKSTKADIKSRKNHLEIKSIHIKDLRLTPVHKPQPPVPSLSYGLDRALFNPGVYHLQDSRSRVFNFDPYLATIMPIQEFDFNALKQYITSSKDNTLISIAAEQSKKYAGSTSSMTSMLAHFHYLLSSWRPVNIEHVSRSFRPDSVNFTRINRAPAATFLHYKDGTYAIDADKEFDSANILSMLGKSMEKLLTLPKEEYEKYRRINSDQITEEQRNEPEAYHYTTMGDFMMRSQLDAYDPRVAGSGMFDLKTRAVVSIRMDAKDFHKGLGYEIRNRYGQWQSYEREYYDMIRSAFLKYSLQVRMGRMDGIFVAFHNTQRIFGFQYISQAEMDTALHGSDEGVGDSEFKASLHLLNVVLEKATARFPGQSLRLHFETRPSDPPFMYIFAKPVTPEDIEEVQGSSKAAIEEFERNILGLGAEEADSDVQEFDSSVIQEDERNQEAAAAAEKEDISPEELASEDKIEQPDEATARDGSDGQTDGVPGGTPDVQVQDTDVNEQASHAVWENVMGKVEETLQNDEQGVMSIRESIGDAMDQIGLLRAYSSEESRRYLDEMLEAITGKKVAAAEDLGSASDSAESPPVEVEEEGSKDEELESPEAEMAESEMNRAQPINATGSNPVVDPTDAAAAQSSQAATESALADEPSLKDLILKLAKAQAAEKELQRSAEEEDDSETSEKLKLRKFGKILTELKAKSQGTGETPSEQADEPESKTAAAAEPAPAPDAELFSVILTTKNKVNGSYVTRPSRLTRRDNWEVEYSIEEIPPARAKNLYQMMLNRRKKILERKPSEGEDNRWYQMFRGDLQKYSKEGRKFRERSNKEERTQPVHVYGMDEPLRWTDVFKDEAVKEDAKASSGEDGGASEAEELLHHRE